MVTGNTVYGYHSQYLSKGGRYNEEVVSADEMQRRIRQSCEHAGDGNGSLHRKCSLHLGASSAGSAGRCQKVQEVLSVKKDGRSVGGLAGKEGISAGGTAGALLLWI